MTNTPSAVTTTTTTTTKDERRVVIGLASLFSLRMFGLFVILPVFSIYANQLNSVTPTRIGIALGIYGLTQALFQIPFGFASDKWGRKPIILIGLGLFCVGSVVAALSESIFGVMIGRALQGAGAVGSTVLALAADLTRAEIRVRAMAVIGITIGFSFALAMILGPFLNEQIGVPGIFWLTAVLSILGVLILIFWIPNPSNPVNQGNIQGVYSTLKNLKNFKNSILKNSVLLRLNFGVLVLHASLTALFLKLPLLLETLGLAKENTGKFYFFILLGSLVGAAPLIYYADKKVADKQNNFKKCFLFSVCLLIFSELGVFYACHSWLLGVGISLVVFFTAFNFLEASLPSLVSRRCEPSVKGTALGIFSSAQFLGLFLGGFLGGILDQHYGIVAVFGFCVILAVVWLWLILVNDE